MGFIGFFLPWLILQKSNNPGSETVPLTSVASYLRFLTGNRNQMLIDIAIHNIAIAILIFILSFFSRGILGCLALFFNLFVIGAVLHDVHTLPTVLFAFLEFLGVCIAVFGGTILSEKRVKYEITLKSIFKFSIIFIFVITFLYFVAAFIESNVILNKWS
jgi:hypothetical protein